LLRLVLRPEVLRRSRNAVLIGPAVRCRRAEEIAVRRRRGGRPLNRRPLPPVISDFLPFPDAPEEIEDEGKLKQREGPRAPRRPDVPVKDRLRKVVARPTVGQAPRHAGQATDKNKP